MTGPFNPINDVPAEALLAGAGLQVHQTASPCYDRNEVDDDRRKWRIWQYLFASVKKLGEQIEGNCQ
jgi:hypothetical protein